MGFDINVLHAMQSADNAHRQAAEAAYNQCLAVNPEEVAQGLLASLPSGAQPDNVRIMAAVLIRQMADHKRGHWARLSPQAREAVRSNILQLVFTEPTPVISNRIAHCVAQLASAEEWPTLLQTVCGYVSLGDAPARTAMFILAQLPEYAPNMMCGNAMSLLPVYSEALQNPNMQLQIGGLKATSALLLALPSDKERAPFTPLVMPVLAALSNALSTQHELEAQEVLTALVEVAQNAVDFFRNNLSDVLDAMLTVASSEGLEFDTRERALEVLITLCQESPARMRRCRSIMQLLPVTYSFMCTVDVDDDEEWVAAPYNADHFVDDEEDYLVGDEGIEHVLEALGKGFLPPTLELALGENLRSNYWPHRRASVALIGRCASAQSKSMKSHLAQCSEALAQAARDPHPRVKFTAVTQIALFCEHFPTEFQRSHHAEIMPVLAELIGDANQCGRVRAHAAACVVNFAKDCDSAYVSPYADVVLGALATCFQPGVGVDVQAEALGAVSCVAEATETKFERYYSCFMPGILGLLEQGNMSSRLRGKALQCVGVMGSSVGITLFQTDAVRVLELLMPSMSCDGGVFPEGYFEYLAPACASIAKALGAHFTQFLPNVLPPLLHTLALKVDVSVKEFDGDINDPENDLNDEESGIQSTVLEVKGRGHMRVTMNTTAVLEKQFAAKTLYEYADCLGEHMVEFIEPCISACIPLIVFRYSENVRGSASFAVGKLFASAVKSVTLGLKPLMFAQQLLAPSIEALTVGIEGERHNEPRCCMSEALRDILQACFESRPAGADVSTLPPVAVTGIDATNLVGKIFAACDKTLERRKIKSDEFEASDELEEEDIERLEEELEEEEELMTNLVDCLGYLLKAQGSQACQLFDHFIAPKFSPLLSPEQPATLRHNALCLFVDIIEFGGQEADKYVSTCAPLFVQELSSSEAYLQQVTAYGIMQIAKKNPQSFGQVFNNSFVVQKLVSMLQAPEAFEPEYELAMENVVACLGAIAASGAVSDAEQVPILSLWLSRLPLRADEIEAKVVHKQLCDLIEQGHPAIVGDEFKALDMVLNVFAQLLESVEELDVGEPDSIVDAETRDRIVAITKQIQSQVSGERVQNAWASLSEEQQGAVQRALA